MQIFYKPPFRKFVKRQTIIEDEVEKIANNPNTGELKKGDLAGFRVHKFSYGRQRFLIAYCYSEAELLFFMVGPHENFYRKLKRYLMRISTVNLRGI